jgi:hypothetical protein
MTATAYRVEQGKRQPAGHRDQVGTKSQGLIRRRTKGAALGLPMTIKLDPRNGGSLQLVE